MSISGDVMNKHGDLHFSVGARPIAEGVVAVSLSQAIAALPFGWRIVGFDDLDSVHIRRGGNTIKCRTEQSPEQR